MRAANTLEHDHRELDELLAEVFFAIEQQNIDLLRKLIDLFWARLAVHIRAEHKHLFPKLLEATRSDSESQIDELDLVSVVDGLRTDHDYFMKELAALVVHSRVERNADLSLVKERLQVLSQRLALHNKAEESTIYPLVTERLSAEDAIHLQAKIRGELENMPSRFADSKFH